MEEIVEPIPIRIHPKLAAVLASDRGSRKQDFGSQAFKEKEFFLKTTTELCRSRQNQFSLAKFIIFNAIFTFISVSKLLKIKYVIDFKYTYYLLQICIFLTLSHSSLNFHQFDYWNYLINTFSTQQIFAFLFDHRKPQTATNYCLKITAHLKHEVTKMY